MKCRQIAAAEVIWAAGVTVGGTVASGLPGPGSGERVVVGSDLSLPGLAIQSGNHAALQVLNRVDGCPAEASTYRDKGDGDHRATLGRREPGARSPFADLCVCRMLLMEANLVTLDGESPEVTPEKIRELIGTASGFWLDLAGLDGEAAEQLLGATFGFHPLAVEDAEHFGQRPKVDGYDDFTFVVVYGATAVGDLVEVHCFYSASFLVTVHRDPCPELASLFERLRQRPGLRRDLVMVLYRVIDILVDGYFPVLAGLDDEIDELEDQILERPTDRQLGRLFDMKRSLIAMRKVVTPQRDMFVRLLGDGDILPGMTDDAGRYFRDVYDHLIRISDLIDSYRDLLTGALDTHLSTVSNRLNVVMKQLTIIATVFLPLSFLTGFFGQNFAWLVDRITTLPMFLGAGIGLEILAAVALVTMFRQRGWLTFDGTEPTTRPSPRDAVDRERRWHVLRASGHDPARRQAPGS